MDLFVQQEMNTTDEESRQRIFSFWTGDSIFVHLVGSVCDDLM